MSDDWSLYDEPCPKCGGTEFLETSVQDNVVYCDENGEIEHIEPENFMETKRVWCRGCDTLLFGDEP